MLFSSQTCGQEGHLGGVWHSLHADVAGPAPPTAKSSDLRYQATHSHVFPVAVCQRVTWFRRVSGGCICPPLRKWHVGSCCWLLPPAVCLYWCYCCCCSSLPPGEFERLLIDQERPCTCCSGQMASNASPATNRHCHSVHYSTARALASLQHVRQPTLPRSSSALLRSVEAAHRRRLPGGRVYTGYGGSGKPRPTPEPQQPPPCPAILCRRGEVCRLHVRGHSSTAGPASLQGLVDSIPPSARLALPTKRAVNQIANASQAWSEAALSTGHLTALHPVGSCSTLACSVGSRSA